MPVHRHLFGNRSLWFKFSIMTVVPVVLAASVLVLTIVQSVETSMHRATRTAMEALIRLTGLSMSNAYVIYNKNLLDSFVDNLADYQDILFAAVVDESDGRVLAHSRHEFDGTLHDAGESVRSAAASKRIASEGDIRVLTHPIVFERKKYGELVIGYSTAEARKDAGAFRGEVLAIAAVAMVLGVLLAVVLARFVSRPINQVATQAQKIGAGESLQTIAYDGVDALGQLVSSFNEMVASLQDRSEQLMTINSIAEKLHQSLDWETIVRQAVDILAEYSGSPSVAVFVRDGSSEVLRLVHHKGFNEETIRVSSVLPMEGTLTGLAVRLGDLVASYDITVDERVESRVRRALVEDGFRGGIVCLPLICKDRIMGVVNFIYKEPYALPEAKRRMYLAIGRTIAMALANADYVARIEEEIGERKRAEEALLRSVREMSTLNALAKKTGQYLSVEQVVDATIESLQFSLDSDVLLMYLLEGDSLVPKGKHAGILAPGERYPLTHALGECLCGIGAQDGIPVFSMDIHTDPRCTRQECKDAGLRSFGALPLFSGERIIGLLCLGSCRSYDYRGEAAFLETISRQVSVSLVNAMLYEQVKGHAAELEKRVMERTEELEVAMRKAREADRIKSAFLASMSHELRTPLNSIIGFTGILLQGLAGALNEEQRKQMGMVRNSARHLLRLINDVLDISKIEAGQLELSREYFNLADTLERVVETVSPAAAKKGLAVFREIDPEIGPVCSDQRRVEQVLINLVNNAVKFTDKGEIRIACRLRASHLVVSVTDTGIGIKREDMGALFEAFRQIHSGVARRYEGTGLGLSICKKLVTMLGGEIGVESRGEGLGSVFTFTLPLTSGVEHET